MAAQIASFTDRFLPSLLIGPIKTSFHLSDFQLGLLLGPAFALFYVTVGLPIGWLADRWSRRSILAIGVAIWCCMTAAGSLVSSFTPLFCSRLGVGLGEAALAPCAISLISDYFPGEWRTRALSLYMTGASLGAGSAFLFVGPLVQWIGSWPPVILPHFGTIQPWQLSFAIIGIPGLLIALLISMLHEPARRELMLIETEGMRNKSSLKGTLRFIVVRWKSFGTLFLGSTCIFTLGTLTVWNVALFQRIWGWNVAEIGLTTGILFFTAGPFGTVVGLWVTNRKSLAGHKDAPMRAMIAGLLIAVPAFAGFGLMPNAPLAVAVLFLAFMGQGMATAAGPSALTLITPGQIRGQTISLYYLVLSVVGMVFGPPPVGWLVDFFGDPRALRYAIAIEAISVGIPALIFVMLGLRHYAKAVLPVSFDRNIL